MRQCEVCGHEIEPKYAFCHVCGAPASGAAAPASSLDSKLVRFVDQAKNFSAELRSSVRTTTQTLDRALGSPVSIQRQVLYSLATGFVLSSWVAVVGGAGSWISVWLLLSLGLFWPIRYWTTGLPPFSRGLQMIFGGELSLRRRLILAAILVLLPDALLVVVLAAAFHLEVDAVWHFRSPFWFLGAYLLTFYLMGFVSSWQRVVPSGYSLLLKGLAGQVPEVVEKILRGIETQKIPGLQASRVDLAKIPAAASIVSGTVGEQISLTLGKARLILFVQGLGDGLFLRTASFYDASGRRLWLILGFFVSFVDRAFVRWFGSSLVSTWGRFLEVLSPGSRQQVLLRLTSGGLIARTLRLVEGVSEYSWNEIHGLEGAAQEAVIQVLGAVAGTHEEAERVRAQIESSLSQERRFSASSRGGR